MVSVGFSSSPSVPLVLKPRCFPSLRSLRSGCHGLGILRRGRKFRGGKCRAELSADAPIAFAIGACILNSLIFPEIPPPEDIDSESLIDSSDARFAVMGIIGFIPYFNWMSWVFAWLDTGKRRYAVYVAVYLAPYLRSNLSLSPEESWLPIASFLICIFHIQLEARIREGDIQGLQPLNEAVRFLSSMGKSRRYSERGDFHNIPTPEEHFEKEARDWVSNRSGMNDNETVDEDEDECDKGDSGH